MMSSPRCKVDLRHVMHQYVFAKYHTTKQYVTFDLQLWHAILNMKIYFCLLFGGFTIITGQSAFAETSEATLPKTNFLNPDLP